MKLFHVEHFLCCQNEPHHQIYPICVYYIYININQLFAILTVNINYKQTKLLLLTTIGSRETFSLTLIYKRFDYYITLILANEQNNKTYQPLAVMH